MFFVFNKDKITAYIVTVFTVMILFLTASAFNKKEESIQTSINEIGINEMNLLIENKIEENNTIKNNIKN